MDKEQGIEVLETIKEVYPKFEITKRKAKVLVPALMRLDYDGTMRKLQDYILENPFPPAISDIAVFPPASQRPEEQEWRKIERFREEAKKVRPETREKFRREMKKLLNKHGVDDDD